MTGHATTVTQVDSKGSCVASCICGWIGTTYHNYLLADPRDAAQEDAGNHLIESEAQPPAEHVATLVARSPGRVVSMTCSCGDSIVGDVMPFAGVTRLMLEHLNGGKHGLVMRDAAGRAALAAPSIDDLVDTFIQRIAGADLTLQQADRIITQARARCRRPIPADTPEHLVHRVFPDTTRL